MSNMTPEMESLKARLKATWMSGDYASFAKPMEPALDSDQQAALREDLEQLWTPHNRATDGTTQYGGEYLEVIAVKA